MTEPFTAPTSREEVERYIADNDVEFLFAQFVDMHGKPNAKLVPATHLDGLLERRGGVRRLRRRRHRPGAARPRPGRDAGHPLAHAAAVEARRRALRLRRARGGRGVAVLPAHDPAPPARARARRSATSSSSAPSSSTSSSASATTARSSSPTRMDDLDQPCYDMRGLTRNLDFVSMVARNITALGWGNYATDHEDANGQFEQNFEFADALTTCDRAIFFRYMVESLAQERGMIATFMPKPFSHLTGNGCHFHMSLWKDGENVFEVRPGRRPARHGPLRDRLPVHRRAEGAREGLHRGHGAHRHVVQAADRRHAQRLELGARVRELRLQQPHADAAHPRGRADRGPDGRRLVQPLPGRGRDAGRRPRRDRATGSTPASRPPS